VRIEAVYAAANAAGLPEAVAVCERLKLTPFVVPDAAPVYASLAAAGDPIGRGKRVLYLARNKGPFIKSCPGTRHYTCCGYRILHVGTYCTMDCSYCILQAYFHPPVLTYFVNHEDLFAELMPALEQKEIQRIGTGEFTDSLIWEPFTGLCAKLVPVFAAHDRAVLEIKTKTGDVEALCGLAHNRRTVLAWSLNTARIIRFEERGTAVLEARLRAAARSAAAGYPLAFHFDPIIHYPGCEEEYAQVVERLFAAVDPRQVAWISLGTLRFMPELKGIIARRFTRSTIAYGEFITGLDGKMRYFKPLRMRLFRRIAAAIRRRAPQCVVYLCMEDDEVWQDALGFTPAERGGLKRLLDEQAVRCCGLDPAAA
jgi:spore photoproduct lyase